MFSRIFTFFKEVRLEIKKVNWPTRKETARYTLIVIAATVTIAIFLGAVDFVVNVLLNKFVIK